MEASENFTPKYHNNVLLKMFEDNQRRSQPSYALPL
jgi:hypothetical protein